MLPQRWRRRPEGSNWGDFGPDDELGRLNLLTPRRCGRAWPRFASRPDLLPEPAARPARRQRAQRARRHPPQLMAGAGRAGTASYNYALSQDDPRWTRRRSATTRCCLADPIFDPMGRLPMSAPSSMPTATAVPSTSTTTAFAPETTSTRRRGRRPGADSRTGPARRLGHREHGRRLRPGPRRADRPPRAFGPGRSVVGYDDLMQACSAQDCGRARRHGLPAHRLHRRAPGDGWPAGPRPLFATGARLDGTRRAAAALDRRKRRWWR